EARKILRSHHHKRDQQDNEDMTPAQVHHDSSGARSAIGRRVLARAIFAPVGDGVFVVRFVQSLTKTTNPLCDIPHQVRNLAASAEQQERHNRENKYVPDAQRTHESLLVPSSIGGMSSAGL